MESSWIVDADGEPLGVARLVIAAGSTEAETGLWLVRRARGCGLGGAVLDELVVIARERGSRSLAASTTADNLAAVRALRRVGTKITRAPTAMSTPSPRCRAPLFQWTVSYGARALAGRPSSAGSVSPS